MSTENLKDVLEIVNKVKQIIDDHGVITTIFTASIAILYYASPFYMPYLPRLLGGARNQNTVTSSTKHKVNDSGDEQERMNKKIKLNNAVNSFTNENQTDDSKLKVEQGKMKKNIKQDDAKETDTVDSGDQEESSQNKNNGKNEKKADDIPKTDTVDSSDQGERSETKKNKKKKEKKGDDVPDKIDKGGHKDDDSDDDGKKPTYTTTIGGNSKVGHIQQGGNVNINAPINLN